MAIRLNWNPQLAPEDVSAEHIAKLEHEGVVCLLWRCGQAKLEMGERVFLVRTGHEPRGVIGMGRTISERDGGYTDEKGQWVPYFVDVAFEILATEPIVARAVLDVPPLDTVAWSNAVAAARVEPHQAAYLEQLILAARPNRGRPAFEIIDPEARHTDVGEVAARDAGEFARAESALVQRFIAAMRARGSQLKAIQFNPPDWPGSLRCDLYDPAKRMIIEAKSDCDRQTIRLAIGQLADYARLHGEPCEKVLLLPRQPHHDLLNLLESQGISAIWEQGDVFSRYPDRSA